MKPHPETMKILLRKREAELQRLIRQMRYDKLDASTVYRNLEHELESLKTALTPEDKKH
jgi:hypothetical protein